MSEAVRVLIVDDDEEDYFLAKCLLDDIGSTHYGPFPKLCNTGRNKLPTKRVVQTSIHVAELMERAICTDLGVEFW